MTDPSLPIAPGHTRRPTTPPSPFPGSPFPLGATVTAGGTNFAVVADGQALRAIDAPDGAAAVELCLVDGIGDERRLAMTELTYGIWHTFVPGVTAGQRYGYRVTTHDSSKLLLDPYARRVDSTHYDLATVATVGADTSGCAPLGIVAEPVRSHSALPRIPWEHTVIYEAHVKGLTARHPAIPPEHRGTYRGLAHPAVIDHLTRLHVTAIELLPVHAHAAEPLLAAAGRRNYWGYSTLSYFAPHPSYASRPGREVHEFADMVDAFHDAGIEVILDVVYNHTCEGGPDQPLGLSWRGLAPSTYYLDGIDLTGCGNTLNTGTMATVRMVTDSLRYWASDLGVDGFRFDLAPVLGRPGGAAFDPASPLLTAIEADPVLRERKLIAEPWDATGDGYSLGRFAESWAEWNDRFRGTVRDFWRGTPGVRQVAYRLSGSEDLFGASRRPWASVNFVTAHDGFTLRDLVSYDRKHNEANGQCGIDGTDDNRSANYGFEGDGTDNAPVAPEIVALRQRQARNIAATLLLATGTPMVCAGDELWRTQRGNNNAFAIDSPDVWVDWAAAQQPDQPAAQMLRFFERVLAIRADAPALHQGEFFSGRPTRGSDAIADLVWFSPTGEAMTDEDWFDAERRTLALWIDGDDVRGHGPAGQPQSDDSYLLVLHAGSADTEITLPGPPFGQAYTPVIDTGTPTGEPADPTPLSAGIAMTVPARSLWLLRAHRTGDEPPAV